MDSENTNQKSAKEGVSKEGVSKEGFPKEGVSKEGVSKEGWFYRSPFQSPRVDSTESVIFPPILEI
jgi:hypothetical protein